MTVRKLSAAEVGYPVYPAGEVDEGGFFALSSHKRAREALRLGLAMSGIGFNIFVVGEDRSGRMSATLDLLDGYLQGRPPQDDWVYLNNFAKPHRPEPHRLPAGLGSRFRDAMAAMAGRARTTNAPGTASDAPGTASDAPGTASDAPGTASDAPGALALADAIIAEFAPYNQLGRWLAGMRQDLAQRLDGFAATAPGAPDAPERRYAVNLLVDHRGETCPSLVIEPNPTFRTLFGCIEYTQTPGGLVTDFTLIRAGALHRANGGILVLRAEALAQQTPVWEFLKGALRDQKIRMAEPHRTGTVPIASAPRPLSVPFDAKVVIVGAPRWYSSWFLNDPESRVWFKIKADICDDLAATPENIAAYVGMIHRIARSHQTSCDEDAVQLLLGMAARWAGHRRKFSSRLELLDDLIGEAALIARRESGDSGDGRDGDGGDGWVDRDSVARAATGRRRRVSQIEDRLFRGFSDGVVTLTIAGMAVGQVNALLVFDKIDHQYGSPCRVTARAWIGQTGIINIERAVNLGGPVQHKGVLGLHGYLAGCFARVAPVSFACSITFEQYYAEIEGDSASLAELLVILSDLSGVPLRQDLAVTGSISQRGDVQSVSGASHKIEGFFRACSELGGLTGTQGVVVPMTNLVNLILSDEVTQAIEDGRFHLWAVTRAEEAVELFTGLPAGRPDAAGRYPEASVYGRVAARLAEFDRSLAERDRRRGV